MTHSRRILWVDQDRFDIKPDKSTWIEISEVLMGMGYDVSILTYARSRALQENTKVSFKFFPAIDFPWVFRYSLLFNILLWLIREAKKEDIIIVHQDGLLICPILWLFRRRNIHLDIRTVPVEISSAKRKVDRWLFWVFPMRFLRTYAKGYSFITDRLRRAIEDQFHIRFDDYVLWTSGVNTNKFIPVPWQLNRQPKDKWVVFYHGTISQARGINRVIEAMTELKKKYHGKIQLVLVGAGPDYQAMRDLCAELDLNDVVTFTGMRPYDEIPKEIAKADCCICPLPDKPEWNISSPIKIFEYMASGKPMILTPIPAHKDIADGYDFVVWTNGEEPRDYQEAIEYAYRNQAKLGEAANSAPIVAKENHEWAIQGQKLGKYLAKTFPLPQEVA